MGLTSNPQFFFEQPSDRYKQPITPDSNTRIDLIHGGKMDVETADYIDPETAGPNADYVWRTRNIKFCDHCRSKAKHKTISIKATLKNTTLGICTKPYRFIRL